MPRQTADRVKGPTGKMKNCMEWALYEPPKSSPEAGLCNGGWVDGDWYDECPAKYDCRRATKEAAEKKRSLPVMNPSKPFGRQSGTKVIGSTSHFEPYQMTPWPTSLPTKQAKDSDEQLPPGWMQPAHPMFPSPIVPPAAYPQAMQTPFVAPTPFHAGGITPTFLPRGKHDILPRLGKNIMQGWIGSAGWHVFDFARSVDMFG